MATESALRRACRDSLLGLGLAAVASGTGSAVAVAAEPGAVEEIVVTARRAEERLQDVPASVSVLTTEMIERAGVTTVEDVVRLTPGISIVTGTAEVGDTQINIRGVNGARDAEGSVALVVDGILKTNTAALNQQQTDLVQIEVLKGPQGAYYGRNAAAGAIVVTTREPGDELELRGRVSGGSDSTYTGSFSVSGPLGDKAGFLLSADHRQTDGFYRNTGPIDVARGATVDQYEGTFVNGRLIVEPTDALKLDIKARYGDVQAGSINYNVVFNLPNLAAAFGSPLFNGDVNEHDFKYLSNIPSDGNQKSTELSVKADWDVGWGRVSAWGLYSQIDNDLIADAAVAAFGFFNPAPECRSSVATLSAAGFQLPPPLILAPTPEASILGAFGPTACDGTQYQVRDQTDLSFELRIASAADAALRWSAGVYYLNIDRQVGVALGYDRGQGILPNLFNPRNSSNPTEQLANDQFDTDVYAAFGSLDYDFSDALAGSLALRFDREERQVSNRVDPTARNQFVRGGNQPLNVGLDFGPLADQSETFEQLQPRVSVAYKPSSSWTYYASAGVGFKSGGFNNQGSRATIESAFNIPAIGAGLVINDRFREEQSTAYEVGVKGAAFDRRLRVELAAYRTEVDDLQFFEFFAGPFGILRVVSNIDEVVINGVELAASYEVLPGWTVSAAGNVNDSEIKENRARPGTVGGKSPYTPDYTLNVGTEYFAGISSSLDLVLRADYRRTGKTWFSTAQEGDRPTLFRLFFGPVLGTGNYANSRRDEFGTLDLRAGVRSQRWSVTAFATNVTDADTIAEVIPAPEFGGSFVSPGDRRAYGLEVGFAF